jgi:hypothetical protein
MAKLISADLTNNILCILEYTTTDGQLLSFKEDAFDAKIVSHTYTDIGKVIFDKPITTIGKEAFLFCTNLTSVTIPDSVTTIGNCAFFFCKSLKEFKGKFAADGGRCLIIDGVLNAFALGCGVTQYTIPDSVTTIGDYAFYECSSLTSVTIGKSVSKIGKEAFKGCNIDTIVCYPKIPPKINDSFDRFENLIVPTGCEEAYANSDWGQYLE